MITLLPLVDRIQGAILHDEGGRDKTDVRIQYTDANEKWCELRVPFLDAMYLLNLLKAIQLDEGFEMSDDPRE